MAKQNTDCWDKMTWARSDACLLLGDGSFDREGESVSTFMHLRGQDCDRGYVEVRCTGGPRNLECFALKPTWAVVEECPNFNNDAPT